MPLMGNGNTFVKFLHRVHLTHMTDQLLPLFQKEKKKTGGVFLGIPIMHKNMSPPISSSSFSSFFLGVYLRLANNLFCVQIPNLNFLCSDNYSHAFNLFTPSQLMENTPNLHFLFGACQTFTSNLLVS